MGDKTGIEWTGTRWHLRTMLPASGGARDHWWDGSTFTVNRGSAVSFATYIDAVTCAAKRVKQVPHLVEHLRIEPAGTPRLWRYDIPPAVVGDFHHDGATVFVDERGLFLTYSAYGAWGHFWPVRYTGCRDIREFLAGVVRDGDDYLIGKLHLGQRKVYDGEATLRNIRRHILEQRREGSLAASAARHEWDFADACGVESDGEAGFTRWYDATELSDAYEMLRDDYPGQLKTLVRRVLPSLAPMLRAELEAEGYFAAPKAEAAHG